VLLDFSVQPLMLGKVTIVGGVVLYPLGVTIDFWEETAYYQPGWQIRASHKASLLMRFIGGQ